MTRTVYLFASNKGFLKDIEEYTHDPLEAITFTNFEIASQRFALVAKLVSNECWITKESIPFPRPYPVAPASKVIN